MKTKHLFYSLALASAFAACTQEELIEAPVVKDNVADRPVAGVVEFKFDEGVESRFNYELKKGFETGDVFGLYLMDEYVGSYTGENNAFCGGEHANANDPWWKYQNHWFGMYQFTNSIQSNYPFRATVNGDDVIWKNDAKLVEGNYFAMFPQNDLALNRRELWRYVEPNVELKEVSTSTPMNRKFQNVENQFWLGYKQIYRDATASAESTMKMNVKMTGAMLPLRISLIGWQGNDVKLDKVSFKNKDGEVLPTLAYVEPAGRIQEAATGKYGWVAYNDAEAEIVDCTAKAHDLYNETETWTRNRVMNLVRWTSPLAEGGRVPYGLDESKQYAAYEYSFDYPANTILHGDVHNGDMITTYVVVPALNSQDDYEDIQVAVYGWKFIKRDNGKYTHEDGFNYDWEYGMLTASAGANYTFLLSDQVNAWMNMAEEADYYRDVEVRFDNFAWTAVAEKQIIATTADMEKMVLGYLSENINKTNISLTIEPDAAGIEIRQSFIDKLEEISKDKKINLIFSGARGGKIYFNEPNTMAVNTKTTETGNYVKFSYENGTKGLTLINKSTQTIPASYGEISVSIENDGQATLTVNGKAAYVKNEGTLVVGGNTGEVVSTDNYGLLTLKKNAVVGTLNNKPAAKAIVVANATATTIVNEYDKNAHENCGNCIVAELVVEAGTLTVDNLTNDAKLTVNKDAAIELVENLTNKKHAEWKHADEYRYALINNGTIKAAKDQTPILDNEGIITNNGVISTAINNYYVIDNQPVSVDGGLTGVSTIVNNEGIINTYNGVIETLENKADKGVLNVYAETVSVKTGANSEGKIYFYGVAPQHVGTQAGQDARFFRTTKAMNTSELFAMMNRVGSVNLLTAYDITLAGAVTDKANYEKIETIVIEGAKVNFSGKEGLTYSFTNAELVVNKDCQLHIEELINLVVKQLGVNHAGEIHVGTNSTLTNPNGEIIHTQESSIPAVGYSINGTVCSIYNAEGMFNVAKAFNGGKEEFAAVTEYVLERDIDLANKAWEPIMGFNKTFNGNNKTVSNLKVIAGGDKESNYYAGIFGTIIGNAIVKDLYIKNADVTAVQHVGALVGAYASEKINGKNVQNCKVMNVTITGLVKISGYWGVGAVVGNNCGFIQNVTVNADKDSYVKATYSTVGGVVGLLQENRTAENLVSNIYVLAEYNDSLGARSNQGAGGVFGCTNGYGNVVTNCSSSSTVEVKNAPSKDLALRIGGISGFVHGGKITFDGCSFTGNLKSDWDGITDAEFANGGLVGSTSATTTIK